MGTVLFISETSWFAGHGKGFPHTAFRVNGTDWYGFKPRISDTPIAPGNVDRLAPGEVAHPHPHRAAPGHIDRYHHWESHILSQVTFHLPDERIQSALHKTQAAYRGKWYFGGARDCVTFSADFAQAIGLRIPPRPNFSPDHFVKSLGRLNGAPVRLHHRLHLQS